MKILSLLASLVLAACDGGSNGMSPGDTDGSGGGGGDVDAAGGGGDPFDPAALEVDVELLASDEMKGRTPGRPGDLATRMHIEERFSAFGLSAVDGSFQQPFVDSVGRETANVVGVLPGSDPAVADQIIVIGAHHDHLGVRNDRIFNGANDNASGVSVVLAAAQAVSQRAEPPRRTIVFATFGSEELGLEGSRYHVRHPPAGLPIEDVVYMINLDMVGTYFNDDQVYAFGSFEGTPARAALEELLVSHPDFTVELGASAVEVEGRGDSDYAPFCRQGIPYLYFFTEDDECYHRSCDDADRLDYLHLAEVAELTAGSLLTLADSDQDLPAARTEFGCGED